VEAVGRGKAESGAPGAFSVKADARAVSADRTVASPKEPPGMDASHVRRRSAEFPHGCARKHSERPMHLSTGSPQKVEEFQVDTELKWNPTSLPGRRNIVAAPLESTNKVQPPDRSGTGMRVTS
jgi:hypothetical protein